MDFVSRNGEFRIKSSKNVTPVGSIILDLPPSCIEFVPPHGNQPWPVDNPCFIVGTYDLQKEEDERSDEAEIPSSVPKEQSRQGSLSLFALKNGQLIKIQAFSTPSAILDLHFFPNSSIFAVASSTGSVAIYKVQARQAAGSDAAVPKEFEYSITPIVTHQVFKEDTIITSFAWDLASQKEAPRLVATCNDGTVKLLMFDEAFMEFEILNEEEPLCQHDYEAWCAVFSHDSESVLSGGDDSKLLISQIISSSSPPAAIRGHNAGVTAILPLPINTTDDQIPIILTGSYDDHIRVIALTPTHYAKSKILAELDIGLGGGGVWKLKFMEDYPKQLTSASKSSTASGNAEDSEEERREGEVTYRVLACCMRVGAKILQVKKGKDGDWSVEVLAVVGVHESMCYASDVVPANEGSSGRGGREQERVVISTSFYDRLLCVWRWNPSIT